MIPTVTLAASHLWSSVAYLTGRTDWPYGWADAVVWISTAALIMVISGWTEPEGPRR